MKQKPDYTIHSFPKSRLATIDTGALGLQKQHVVALLEVDVTLARIKIKHYKKNVGRISFSAWLVKTISHSLTDTPAIAAFYGGNSKILTFTDINVSFLVEKEVDGQKVPFPLVIEKANERSLESITLQIYEAKNLAINSNDVVLQRKTTQMERYYYLLPGNLRRLVWRILLKNPSLIYRKMGNVSVTSLGIAGKISGWFIPISIHPVCFGIGSVIKKPVVVGDCIEIREIDRKSVV